MAIFGNIKNIFGFNKKDKVGKDAAKQQESASATQRAEGIAGKNLSSDVAGSTDIGVRRKLELINQLQRDGGRRFDLSNIASLSDAELTPLLTQATSNLRDPFYAVGGGSSAFASVKERFNQLVARSQKSAAQFQQTKEVKMDLPGQSQTSSNSILGGGR